MCVNDSKECMLKVCVCVRLEKKKFLEYKFYGTIIIIALGWYVWVDKIVIVKKGVAGKGGHFEEYCGCINKICEL